MIGFCKFPISREFFKYWISSVIWRKNWKNERKKWKWRHGVRGGLGLNVPTILEGEILGFRHLGRKLHENQKGFCFDRFICFAESFPWCWRDKRIVRWGWACFGDQWLLQPVDGQKPHRRWWVRIPNLDPFSVKILNTVFYSDGYRKGSGKVVYNGDSKFQ